MSPGTTIETSSPCNLRQTRPSRMQNECSSFRAISQVASHVAPRAASCAARTRCNTAAPYIVVSTTEAKSGLRDNASATTLRFPGTCTTSKSNYDRKSNVRACLRDRFGCVCRYRKLAWSLLTTKRVPNKKCLHLRNPLTIATNSRFVAS